MSWLLSEQSICVFVYSSVVPKYWSALREGETEQKGSLIVV